MPSRKPLQQDVNKNDCTGTANTNHSKVDGRSRLMDSYLMLLYTGRVSLVLLVCLQLDLPHCIDNISCFRSSCTEPNVHDVMKQHQSFETVFLTDQSAW